MFSCERDLVVPAPESGVSVGVDGPGWAKECESAKVITDDRNDASW